MSFKGVLKVSSRHISDFLLSAKNDEFSMSFRVGDHHS